MNAGRTFLDTNVVVYAYDDGEPKKDLRSRPEIRGIRIENPFP